MSKRAGKAARPNWRVGQRVSRFDADEHGVVIEADDKSVKIRWESGATSVFRHGKPGDVQFVSRRRIRNPPEDSSI